MRGGAAVNSGVIHSGGQRSSLSSYQMSNPMKQRYVNTNPHGLANATFASSLGLKPANNSEISQNNRRHKHAKYNSQEKIPDADSYADSPFPLGNQSLKHAAQTQGRNPVMQS